MERATHIFFADGIVVHMSALFYNEFVILYNESTVFHNKALEK